MRQEYPKKNRFSFKTFAKTVILLLLVLILIKPAMRYFYPVNYMAEIDAHSTQYGLDRYLVMALISAESKFDKDARSHKDAKGLMQLKSETALWCIEKFSIDTKGRDIYDADLNIETGCAYLRYLIDKFGSDIRIALCAYNAGEGNVTKWLESQNGELRDIPFAETAEYADTVLRRVRIYEFLYGRYK